MKTINPLQGDLVWRQVASRSYEFRANQRVVATLRWVKPIGARAVAKTAEGQWDLKEMSTFGPWIHIRRSRSRSDVATFGQCALDQPCVVRFADGDEYVWRPIWGSPNEMGFENKQGDIVIRFAPIQHALQYQAAVTFRDLGTASAKLTLLAVLGWYVLVRQHEEELTAGAVIALATMS